ncbi:CBS domain-containing protein [Bdellovibrionota bacterium FG-1]
MIKDILSGELVSVEPNTKVQKVAELMAAKNVGCVVVLDGKKPRGVITDRDIVVRCFAKNLDMARTLAKDVSTDPLVTCRDTDGFFDCIKKMQNAGVRRIVVVDQHAAAIGVVSFGDLIGVLAKEFYLISETTTALDRQAA